MDVNPVTAYTNTISHNGTNAVVQSFGGRYLQFNNNVGTGNDRFRYYGGNQAIQLYRRSGTFSSTPSCTCPAPSNFAASSITSSTAYLSWTANGTESRWQVVVSETELGDPSTETMHLVGATNYTAMSLSPLTSYYAYVRAKCDEDDFSGWIMTRFTTTCLDWSPTYALNHTSETLEAGQTLSLEVSGDGGRDVEWSTSNPAVATVSNTGVVTAVAEGYCVIAASVETTGDECEKRAICNIHVSTDDCHRVGWGN